MSFTPQLLLFQSVLSQAKHHRLPNRGGTMFRMTCKYCVEVRGTCYWWCVPVLRDRACIMRWVAEQSSNIGDKNMLNKFLDPFSGKWTVVAKKTVTDTNLENDCVIFQNRPTWGYVGWTSADAHNVYRCCSSSLMCQRIAQSNSYVRWLGACESALLSIRGSSCTRQRL